MLPPFRCRGLPLLSIISRGRPQRKGFRGAASGLPRPRLRDFPGRTRGRPDGRAAPGGDNGRPWTDRRGGAVDPRAVGAMPDTESRGGLRVLVVDDNRDAADTLRVLLE